MRWGLGFLFVHTCDLSLGDTASTPSHLVSLRKGRMAVIEDAD